jgi:hypothetical protein
LRRLYAKWDFRELPFDPRRTMMVRMVDLQQTFSGDTTRE